MGIMSDLPRAVPNPPRWHQSRVIILVLYFLYLCTIIFQSSFVLDSTRHFVLFDDAMISMRYASNLAEGHGLRWNPTGEAIEGFTNPLWTMMMAAAHLLPLAREHVSAIIQIVGALILVAHLWKISRVIEHVVFARDDLSESARHFWCFSGTALVALFFPLNFWGTSGLEVGFIAFLMSSIALQLICDHDARRAGILPWLLLVVGLLTRQEMILFAPVLIFAQWTAARRAATKSIAVGLIALMLSAILITAARYAYYGMLLPNTYYLKMSGINPLYRVSRGAFMYGKFILQFNPLFVLAPLAWALRRRSPPMLILTSIFLIQSAYSIYVGGDAFGGLMGANRFMSPIIPLLLVILISSLLDLRAWLIARVAPRLAKGACVFLLLAILMHFNSGLTLRQSFWTALTEPGLFVRDSSGSVTLARAIESATQPDATIAVCFAGATPYFADRNFHDLLGKCDAHIAAGPSHFPAGASKWTSFHPGHTKWDLDYSIGEIRPDVVVEFTGPLAAPEYKQVLARDYTRVVFGGFPLYLRNDSSHLTEAARNSVSKPPGIN